MAQVQVTDANGRKVYIPEHYLDHPILKKGFTRLPSDQQNPMSGAQVAADPQGVNVPRPDESWSHAELDKFATDKGLDISGATTKAEKVAAMTTQES